MEPGERGEKFRRETACVCVCVLSVCVRRWGYVRKKLRSNMHAMLALDDVAPYVISHLDLADIFRLRHVLGAAFTTTLGSL